MEDGSSTEEFFEVHVIAYEERNYKTVYDSVRFSLFLQYFNQVRKLTFASKVKNYTGTVINFVQWGELISYLNNISLPLIF